MRTCSDASQVSYLGTPIAFHCNSLCHDRTTRLSSHMISASGGLVVCVACAGLAVRFSRLQQQPPITTNYGTRSYPTSLCSPSHPHHLQFTLTWVSPVQRLHLCRLKQLVCRILPTHFSRVKLWLEAVLLAPCVVACVHRGRRLACFTLGSKRTLSSLCLQVALPSLAPLIKLIRISSCERVDNNFPPHSSLTFRVTLEISFFLTPASSIRTFSGL